jgi:hypothetical protein
MSGRHWRRARVEKPDLVVARQSEDRIVKATYPVTLLVPRGEIAVGHTVGNRAETAWEEAKFEASTDCIS